ncbi:hypothetical protein JB92DRAFT_2940942 [Gautieria morchelliformis]|nr:hypothetical protein JB92DRAFT_2940942 [Gautieria morchelliformis]
MSRDSSTWVVGRGSWFAGIPYHHHLPSTPTVTFAMPAPSMSHGSHKDTVMPFFHHSSTSPLIHLVNHWCALAPVLLRK